MARMGNKRTKKGEHSKVKLKGTKDSKIKGKKLLPKGTNVTDTSFKVKKIVIKDQLKQHDEDEILTKKNLSCRDLTSRLTHHNNSIRHEAITGLKELMSGHASELIDSSLPLLIDSISKLILDMSSEVRKSGIRLMTNILSQIKEPSRQLQPLFPLLSSYLICGLTNINQFIREDSLHLLDSMLKYSSQLCVPAIPKLLPICLDLMSNNSTGSRTLSLNLDSKLSSGVWRGNVLARIWTLLRALHSANKVTQKDALKPQTIFISKDSITSEKTYLELIRIRPVYNLDFNKQKLSLNKPSFYSKENAEGLDLKEFAEALIPLLFESFIEMIPPKEILDETRTVTNISSEAALNMKFIVEIIQLIWDLFEIQPGSEEKLIWMKTKFGKTFTNSIINDRFPYSIDFEYDSKKKKSKHSNFLLGSIWEDGCSPNCLLQNLTLTHLILLLAPPSYLDIALSYLKDCLRNSSEKFSQEESSVVVSCLSRICSHYPKEVTFCLDSLNKLSNSSNVFLKLRALKILYSIVDDKNLSHLHSDPSFESWLTSLPKRLTKQLITSEEISVIYDIARRQTFEVFCKELDAYIEVILDNIVRLKIVNEDYEEEARRRLVHLLYWVRDWDEELGASLEEGVRSNYWGDRLTTEVGYILASKQEKLLEATTEME